MGLTHLTCPSLSRAKTRARKLAKTHGIRWAASFLMALGYSVDESRAILLG